MYCKPPNQSYLHFICKAQDLPKWNDCFISKFIHQYEFENLLISDSWKICTSIAIKSELYSWKNKLCKVKVIWSIKLPIHIVYFPISQCFCQEYLLNCLYQWIGLRNHMKYFVIWAFAVHRNAIFGVIVRIICQQGPSMKVCRQNKWVLL